MRKISLRSLSVVAALTFAVPALFAATTPSVPLHENENLLSISGYPPPTPPPTHEFAISGYPPPTPPPTHEFAISGYPPPTPPPTHEFAISGYPPPTPPPTHEA